MNQQKSEVNISPALTDVHRFVPVSDKCSFIFMDKPLEKPPSTASPFLQILFTDVIGRLPAAQPPPKFSSSFSIHYNKGHSHRSAVCQQISLSS